METTPRINVTVWNEYRHEKTDPRVTSIYPDGMHQTIAGFLRAEPDMNVGIATLDEPDHGLTAHVLERTDVLIWWGHRAHSEVADPIVEKVHARVLRGMGLIALHSAHFSKIFKRLMGTNCSLKWRVAEDRERIWTILPAHPIAQGIGPSFELPIEEMYGEVFEIPNPEELVFISWFTGGEVFRSGCTWRRGAGRIFYFRPGHETFPTYHDPTVQRVITNAVRWARPAVTGSI
jgi:trehalose utilization protein